MKHVALDRGSVPPPLFIASLFARASPALLSALLLTFAVVPAGCGYRSANSGPDPALRLAVVAVPGRVPDAAAVQAALAGARAELSRAGALRPGSEPPRLVIELTRIDEIGTGIVAPDDLPLARGAAVGVAGHAWVEEHERGEADRDVGDMRRSEHIALGRSEGSDAVLHAHAVRSAAHELGRGLARRALGQPEPADPGL